MSSEATECFVSAFIVTHYSHRVTIRRRQMAESQAFSYKSTRPSGTSEDIDSYTLEDLQGWV